jgi:hypothetical protein
MATIPSRVKPLEDCIKSILPQCDKLNIYLNNFGSKPTPPYLKHPKIIVFRSEDEAGDIGDVGKFYCCEEWKDCYAFTVDDKYIYASDYASRLIATIEKYGRKAVISCHGRLIKPNCVSYYMDPLAQFNLGGEVKEDTFVHECGTGCMALHTDTFRFTLDMFPFTNMSDILAGIALQKENMPILIMAHKQGWIWFSPKCDNVYSIHNFCNRSDTIQTKTVNEFQWKINTCKAIS